MRKDPEKRIVIKADVLKALRLHALEVGTEPHKLVDTWLRERLGLSAQAQEGTCGASADIEESKKPKPKSKLDPKVIAQIKEAWVSTHNRSEISRRTGVERAKVSRYVIRLINDGELKE